MTAPQVTADLAKIHRILDELAKAKNPKIAYSEDTLQMANEVIKQMKYHIEVAEYLLNEVTKNDTMP